MRRLLCVPLVLAFVLGKPTSAAAAAIDFYRHAFGARETMRLTGPGGSIAHAELAIGDGLIIVAVGVVFFALVETEKQMRLAFRRARDKLNRANPTLDQSRHRHSAAVVVLSTYNR